MTLNKPRNKSASSPRNTTTTANNTNQNTKARNVKKLPMSGSEPVYTDSLYQKDSERLSANCYSFALGILKHREGWKLQPGELSGGSDEPITCKNVLRLALRDGKGSITRGKWDRPCPKGSYKIAAMVSPGGGATDSDDPESSGLDYHWAKQVKTLLYTREPGESLADVAVKFRVPRDKVSCLGKPHVLVEGAGVWAHKRGLATGGLLVDAKNKVIIDPRKASWDYGSYSYSKQCGCLCVRRSGTQAGNAKADQALLRERLAWAKANEKKGSGNTNKNVKNVKRSGNNTKKDNTNSNAKIFKAVSNKPKPKP